MEKEMIPAEYPEYTGPANVVYPSMPTAGYDDINQGTVAIETSRAVAEAQGKLVLAKKFPRNEIAAYEKAIQSCKREAFAKTAFYSFPKSGSTVSGPSIRFTEELARCWGNVDYGIKELSRDDAKSEMQAFAWDMETNTISSQNFTNPHYREASGKMKKLSTERDIYENNANMAARRLRARILAILPSWFVDDCVNECKKTLAGKNDSPLIDRVRAMALKFNAFGVSTGMIEERLGRKIETMTVDDFTDYIGIYNSLKDKQASVSDWFSTEKKTSEASADILDALKGED